MNSSRPRFKCAFSLVEVVLALGICSFCLLVLLGLLSVSLADSRISSQNLKAAHIAEGLLASRRISPTNVIANLALPPLGTSSQSASPIPLDEFGESASTGNAQYGLSYQIVAPTSKVDSAFVHISLQWPATANPSSAEGRYEIATYLPVP